MDTDQKKLKLPSEFHKIQKQEHCHHPKLLVKNKTGETICASCGRTIYAYYNPK